MSNDTNYQVDYEIPEDYKSANDSHPPEMFSDEDDGKKPVAKPGAKAESWQQSSKRSVSSKSSKKSKKSSSTRSNEKPRTRRTGKSSVPKQSSDVYSHHEEQQVRSSSQQEVHPVTTRPEAFTSIAPGSDLGDRIVGMQRGESTSRLSPTATAASVPASDEAKPGSFTAVYSSTDDPITRKQRGETARSPQMPAPFSMVRAGSFTAVQSLADDRIARKQREESTSRLSSTGPAIEPTVPDSMVRAGSFTAVQSLADDRIARKQREESTSRLSSTGPAIEPTMPASMVRAGSFTAVQSLADDRIARKQREESTSRLSFTGPAVEPTVPDSMVRAGSFTAVQSLADDRIARKQRKESTSRLSSTGPAVEPTVPDSMVRAGSFTAVQSLADDRIARKQHKESTSRLSFTGPAIEPTVPDSMVRAGSFTAVQSLADDRIARKQRKESTSRLSSTGPAVEPTSIARTGNRQTRPGSFRTIDYSTDGRKSRKMGASGSTDSGMATAVDVDNRILRKRRSDASLASKARIGVLRNMDERIAAKQVEYEQGSPEAVIATDDRKVLRTVSSSGPSFSVGAQSARTLDERIRQKKISNQPLNMSPKEDEVIQPGASVSTGDDPAASKARQSAWITDEIFHDEDGDSIDAEDYLKDIVAEVDKKGMKKDKDVMVDENGEPTESKPGAYSAKASLWGFLRGHGSIMMSKRSQMGQSRKGKNARNSTVTDTDVEGVTDDYIDERGLSFLERVDKVGVSVGICIAICVFLAITLPVFLINSGNDPKVAPVVVEDYEKVLFPISGMETFDNLLSPQSRAFDFIVHKDPLSLPVDSLHLVQRYIIMVMYFSNSGESWRWSPQQMRWGSASHECDWQYIDCAQCNKVSAQSTDGNNASLLLDENAKGRWLENLFYSSVKPGTQCITNIGISAARLSGNLSIPPELIHLPNLEIFDVADNDLQGSIPEELYSLTNLKIIYLEQNAFTGSISDAVGDLTNLRVFSVMENNMLNGTLPDTMRNLVNMEKFWTSLSTNLRGLLFDIVLSWPNLEELDVTRSAFEGTVPVEVSNLSSLRTFVIKGNNFVGPLPTEIGLLASLERLVVSSNKNINGSLPSEIGTLEQLVELRVDSTSVQGSIPTELGNLGSAKIINLAQNNLDGTIPTELGGCSSATEMSLFLNKLVGTVPTELGQLFQMQTLYLQRNRLTGDVPLQICNRRQ